MTIPGIIGMIGAVYSGCTLVTNPWYVTTSVMVLCLSAGIYSDIRRSM